MSSHYTIVNNNYIIVNNIFNDCIIIYAGSVFFGTPCILLRTTTKQRIADVGILCFLVAPCMCTSLYEIY